jgi:DNA helicase-2/ATP-dependent DNA helicase PcrA
VKNINKLLELINLHSVLAAKESPTKILLHFAYDSGLLKNLDIDQDLETFSYLNQLYQKIRKLEETAPDLKLKDFLEAINLELEAGETGALKLDFSDNETVKIMTVHGAKGLEFKYVFIVNLVDKKFPTINRGEKISIPEKLVKEIISESSESDFHLEEERRLFYVAMTRAKEGLFLSGAKDYGGAREKKPSRFIEEAGLVPIESANLKLSEQNEFLRDLHRLNTREIINEKIENYPLPDKFSFSQLAAYSSCPLQYKFAFILKVPVLGDKASLIFGRVLHNTLYNFFLPLLDKNIRKQESLFNEPNKKESENPMNFDRLLELYEEFWQADGYQSKKEREEYKQKGLKAITDYWKAYQKEVEPKVLFLEKKFSFRIGEDIIKGTIDRVDELADGTIEIIDYKTGKEKTLDYNVKKQLILYQIFLEEFLNKKVSALSYYYLESGQKASFVATEKEVTKLRVEVMAEIAEIKKRNFIAKPSPLCKFCDFNSICEFAEIK